MSPYEKLQKLLHSDDAMQRMLGESIMRVLAIQYGRQAVKRLCDHSIEKAS